MERNAEYVAAEPWFGKDACLEQLAGLMRISGNRRIVLDSDPSPSKSLTPVDLVAIIRHWRIVSPMAHPHLQIGGTYL